MVANFSLTPTQMEWLLQVLNDARGKLAAAGFACRSGGNDQGVDTRTPRPDFWSMEMAGAFLQAALLRALGRRRPRSLSPHNRQLMGLKAKIESEPPDADGPI